MKILFLAPQPFYVERGTPIAVRLAVSALCRAGHAVDLLTYHEGEDIEIPGMRLIRISRPPGVSRVPIGFSPKKLVCDAWMAARAYALLARGRYDVVHAVEEAVFIALLAKPFRRFRLVYDMDSLMAEQIAEKWPAAARLLPAMRVFEHAAMRRSDLVLAVCPAIADRASAVARPGRVHLTPDVAFAPSRPFPDGVEELRAGLASGEVLALYVGNLETYQGVGVLLEALARLPAERRCRLAVVGGAPAAVAEHAARAEAAGIGRQVRFLGQRPLDHLPAYLAQADILCSPRLKGVNTPMKIYSYMAAGRAILATGIASHRQVLDESCALLTGTDPAAMAEGLAALTDSAALRARLGQAAGARAGDLYSQAAFDGRLRRAYAQIDPAARLAAA